MKVISLVPGTKLVKLEDRPEPVIQNPDQLKVKVIRVGICGTDREEVSGGRAAAPPGKKELVIGHEMLSQVVEVGKNITQFKKGDFVVITVRRGCGVCAACNMFRSDLCTTGNYTERGIKSRDGFQAEYVVDEQIYTIKVPPQIVNIAVLAEPMSVVQKAIDEAGIIQTSRLPYLPRQSNWLEGKTVFVAGMGPIGLLAALVLRLRGATVLGMDIVDNTTPRAQLIKEMGGTYVDGRKLKPEQIHKDYPHIDMIIDAAGIAKLDFNLLDLLGINGIFVLTGVPGDQRLVDIDGAALMRQMVLKNQVMVGSVNESIVHFEKGIKDLQGASIKWPGLVEKMITNRFPYEQFPKGLSNHNQDEIKVIIEWEGLDGKTL